MQAGPAQKKQVGRVQGKLQQSLASFMLQDLRRYAMFDSSATRPYTVSAMACWARAQRLGYITLDPAGKVTALDHNSNSRNSDDWPKPVYDVGQEGVCTCSTDTVCSARWFGTAPLMSVCCACLKGGECELRVCGPIMGGCFCRLWRACNVHAAACSLHPAIGRSWPKPDRQCGCM